MRVVRLVVRRRRSWCGVEGRVGAGFGRVWPLVEWPWRRTAVIVGWCGWCPILPFMMRVSSCGVGVSWVDACSLPCA